MRRMTADKSSFIPCSSQSETTPHQSVLVEIHQNAPILQGHRQAGRQLPDHIGQDEVPQAQEIPGYIAPGVELNT